MENFDTINKIDKKDESSYQINDKRSLITFAKLNKYFLIPFLCPIFCMLANFFDVFIDESEVINKQEFIYSIFFDLSYAIEGLFYFISYFKTKVNKEKESKTNTENQNTGIIYIYNDNFSYNYNNINKIIMIIVLLSILLEIQNLLMALSDYENVFEERLYFIFFIPLFSKIILKENIYKHQYFSLLIAILGFILLSIPVCLELTKDDIISNILNLIDGFIYPLFIVIIKYVSEKYYLSPLKLSLLFGILATIIDCIGYIIYSLIKFHNFSYFNDCFDFSQVENKLTISIYLILYFLFLTILQLLILLAIFYFSPTLIMVTDIISPFLLWIAVSIEDGESILDSIINPCGYLIVLFGALIYNEIIIFNFCGLDKNTKKFVNQRLYQELREIQQSKDNLPFDTDDEEI